MASGQSRNPVRQQAKHDRSVIDHLIHTFHDKPAERQSDHTVERSEAIYHQIRRTWAADQQHLLYRK